MKSRGKMSHRKDIDIRGKNDFYDEEPVDLLEQEWERIMHGGNPRLEMLQEKLSEVDIREMRLELNLLIMSALCGREIDKRWCELLSSGEIEKVQKAIYAKIFGGPEKI